MRNTLLYTLLVGTALTWSLSGATITVAVPGTANPFLAGMPSGSTCCADSIPAPPRQVLGLSLVPGGILTFSVTGSVAHFSTTPTDPPDGVDLLNMTNVNGIAGALNIHLDALVAVFLNGNQPDSSLPPPGLDFGVLGLNFPSLQPVLKQIFFVGDGLTGNGSGTTQTFVVPTGATRLFLAAADGSNWNNNTGSFQVRVTETDGATPEPSTAACSALGLGLMLLFIGSRRKASRSN